VKWYGFVKDITMSRNMLYMLYMCLLLRILCINVGSTKTALEVQMSFMFIIKSSHLIQFFSKITPDTQTISSRTRRQKHSPKWTKASFCIVYTRAVSNRSITNVCVDKLWVYKSQPAGGLQLISTKCSGNQVSVQMLYVGVPYRHTCRITSSAVFYKPIMNPEWVV